MGEYMSEQSELLAGAGVEWEREVRGYNRMQVDNYVAYTNSKFREYDAKIAQDHAELDRLQRELAEAREAGGRPAYEEVPARIAQILKLADDEAKADRDKATEEISALREAAKQETDKLRADVKGETDRLRAEAQDRAERMLAAAQEQSERSVASARAEADEMLSSAHAAAEQAISDASKHAESTVTAAMAQAKQQLDEATARATAIHDGAERRLNLLISRHTETVRRLTEIRDVVTSLVSGEVARGSLEDEVTRALGAQAAAASSTDGRPGGHHDPQAAALRTQRQAGPAAGTALADGRRPAAQQPGPLDGQPDQPASQGGRAAVAAPARASLPGQSGSRDQTDPLTADRRDGPRYQTQGVDTSKRVADEPDDPTDEVRQASDAHTHPGDSPRHSSSAVSASPRALDETPAAGSRGIES